MLQVAHGSVPWADWMYCLHIGRTRADQANQEDRSDHLASKINQALSHPIR